MFSPRDIYANFIGLMTVWGLGLGALLGAVYLFVYLAFVFLSTSEEVTVELILNLIPLLLLAPFGAFVGATVDTGLGITLGILLALLTHRYFFPLGDVKKYRTLMLIAAAMPGFLIGMFTISAAYPMTAMLSPFLIISSSVIASGAAAYAANRVAKWYVSAASNPNNFGGGHVEHS